MKRLLRLFAAGFLLLSMVLLTGCGGLSAESVMNVIAPTETPIPGSDIVFSDQHEEEVLPLECTYQEMDGNFCPFWASKDGDKLVTELTQLHLTRPVNGMLPAEITRTENEDGSLTVIIRLKKGLVSSDGFLLGSNDLVFTYYVLLDASYDGPYLIKTLPIRGLPSYWNGMDMDMYAKYVFLYDDIYREGRYDQDLRDAVDKAKMTARENGVSEKELENDPVVKKALKALEEYDSERAAEIRSAIEAAWREDADELVDYIVSHYSATMTMDTNYTIDDVLASEGLQVMFAMKDRMFGTLSSEDGSFTSVSGTVWNMVDEFPTAEDFYKEMYAAYNGDAEQYWRIEGVGRSNMLEAVENDVVMRWASADPDWRGSVNSIEGIQTIDAQTIGITLDVWDDSMVEMLTDIYVAPLHVYGNMEMFDVGKGNYGFTKGDLRAVKINAKIAIGCGEFVYRETDLRTVYLDANRRFWAGTARAETAVLTKE